MSEIRILAVLGILLLQFEGNLAAIHRIDRYRPHFARDDSYGDGGGYGGGSGGYGSGGGSGGGYSSGGGGYGGGGGGGGGGYGGGTNIVHCCAPSPPAAPTPSPIPSATDLILPLLLFGLLLYLISRNSSNNTNTTNNTGRKKRDSSSSDIAWNEMLSGIKSYLKDQGLSVCEDYYNCLTNGNLGFGNNRIGWNATAAGTTGCNMAYPECFAQHRHSDNIIDLRLILNSQV